MRLSDWRVTARGQRVMTARVPAAAKANVRSNRVIVHSLDLLDGDGTGG